MSFIDPILKKYIERKAQCPKSLLYDYDCQWVCWCNLNMPIHLTWHGNKKYWILNQFWAHNKINRGMKFSTSPLISQIKWRKRRIKNFFCNFFFFIFFSALKQFRSFVIFIILWSSSLYLHLFLSSYITSQKIGRMA